MDITRKTYQIVDLHGVAIARGFSSLRDAHSFIPPSVRKEFKVVAEDPAPADRQAGELVGAAVS